jgi:hypothetical protein
MADMDRPRLLEKLKVQRLMRIEGGYPGGARRRYETPYRKSALRGYHYPPSQRSIGRSACLYWRT